MTANTGKKSLTPPANAEINKTPRFDASKVVVKKLVTVPQLKWVDGKTVYLRFDGAIYLSKQNMSEPAAGSKDKKMEPPHIALVTELESGKSVHVIVGAVMKSEIEGNYPDNGYVGKCFAVTQQKIEGKRYKGYQVAEIEVGQ